MDYGLYEAKISMVKSAMLASIRTSWEQGVAVDSLTELDFPEYTVYGFSGNITRHTTHPPRDVDTRRLPVQVVQFALSAAIRQSADGRLSQMINDDRGSAALDGASAGMAVLTGKYLNNSYSAYLSQAARKQLNYVVDTAPRTSTGAISHRTSSKENWADAVYMGFPFIASYGTATFNQTLLQLAYDQCRLHRNVLRVPEAGIWAHIWSDDKKAFSDKGLWATGNAWAAKGMLNVAILIDKSSKNMTTQVSDLKCWVKEILNGTFARLDSDNLVPNYMTNVGSPGANDTFGDAAASALLAATAYRAASSWPADFGTSYIDNAEKIKESVMTKITDLGLLSPVVNPVSWHEKGVFSAEAQAFGIMMYAAWRDWADSVKAGRINLNRIRKFSRDASFGHDRLF
ncbi:glycoside hydrolase family protein [Rhizoctonia solani AG-3 Rhs1AP]|uniref:Glycoside hydrolase family protein n=2 Tax=Rhizoctonia solani AG-3 TaxID=1086053 RepID=A0A074SH38_9AGAM|nr:glycoside hydrolase family protein [Rhizoctonia solani AG-3 Rhs1AP]KEP49317.1 glycoside hydrolase family protein [Rhizoctonia solani 123E]